MGSSNNYSVKLGIKLDEKAVANISNELNTKLKDKNVNISIDAKNLEQIKDLLNNIYLELGRIESKNGFSAATKGAKAFNEELKNTTKHIKNQSFATDNWIYNWSKAMQSFLTYNTVTQFFNTASNGIKDMIVQVKELDDALTELKKVTDLEGEALERFVDDAYKAGESVAKTGTEMIEAATAFAKAGFKDEALELGTVAAMYTNIADEAIDAADAADMIIAQMKAFNIEASDSIHIIDAINEVSNNFAVSSADIASNLGKASAVVANAGNSMEQYIGMMTAITEVTRNASKAANGLKTITLRLQGMNDEGEKDLQLQAQMEALFQKLGISVYNANGELKNTYEILDTLAPVYETLTNAEKAYVSETLAGKYQAQNLSAAMINWKTAVEATNTALESNGSASAENEKVLDSIQGHLQQLNSAWEELSRNVFDSNLLKFVIDLGTGLLKLAGNDTVQGIAKLAISLAAINMAMNAFSSAKLKIDLFTNGITKNTTALIANRLAESQVTKQTQQAVIKLLAEKGAVDKNTKSITKETQAKIQAKLAAAGLNEAEQKAVLASMNQITANGMLSASTFSLKGAWDALTASIAANPIGAILVAVTATASIITSLVNSSQQKAEEQREALKTLNEEAISSYNDAKTSLEEEINKVKELKEELADHNITQSEAIKIKDQLVDIQKNLVDSYGSEAESIDLVNGKLDEEIAKIEKLKKQKAQDYLTENSSNIANIDMVTIKQNMLGANNIGVSGANEDFIDDLLSKQWTFDVTDSRTYAEWFYNQIKERIEELNTAYNKALNDGNEDLANKTKKQLDELTTYSSQYKEQAENSVKTFDSTIDAYITVNDTLSDVYKKLADGSIKSQDTLDKAWDELENMKSAGTISEDWADNVYEYLREMYAQNWEEVGKANEKAAKDALDMYQKSALGRTEAGRGSAIDTLFGDQSNVTDKVKELYAGLKEIADVEALTEEKAQEVIDRFDEFSIVNDQLTDSLGNSLGSFQELRDYFNVITDEMPNGKSILEDYSLTLDSLTDKYNMLTAAVDEYNEAGYLSSETLANMINNDLLNYLSYENGQLIANTEELYNNAESARISASQKLYNAMVDDMLAVAEGNVENASSLAQSAVANLGNNAEAAGNQAANAVNKFIDFAEAVDLSNKALAGKEMTSDVKKNVQAVQNAYKPYFDLLSKTTTIERKKYTGNTGKKSSGGSGSSSSSKKEKEWWEQAYDDLKDQFNYSEITIEQYIGGLENLLGKLDKGSEAWKKINKELQKQKLDKVKDDYNAGRISLSKYIKELEKLQQAYAKGTDGWNNLADAIKKAKLDQLKNQQSDLKSALSAVTDTLDKQIDKYNELKDAADDRYDEELDKLDDLKDSLSNQSDDYERAQKAVTKFLDEQLSTTEKERDAIEEYYDYVIDAMEKQKEEQEESLELAEAYEALMNAMTQKTKKVYKEGLGWVWEADSKAIAEAKKNYDDLVHNASVKEIEKQKDSAVKSLDEQIESLQNYINSWDEVFDKFDNEKNTNLANLLLGENWTEMVSQLDPQVVEDFSNAYYDLQKNIEETEKQIEELNKQKDEEDEYWKKLIDDLKDYKSEWSDIADIYDEAQDALKAKQLIGADWEKQILEQRLDVLENFKNKYNAILAEIDKVDNMSTTNASSYNPVKLPGYAEGGEVDYTGLAMLHGTPSRPEYVLNNSQMRNLLSNLTKPSVVSNVKSGNSEVYNYSFGNIELPNVSNAKQFISELKSLINTSRNK